MEQIIKIGLSELKMMGLFVHDNTPVIKALQVSKPISKQIKIYQAGLIFRLMSQYNEPGNVIFEIGTRLGFSASIIAQAAPLARVITLEKIMTRIERACGNLEQFNNVRVKKGISWEILRKYQEYYKIEN